MSGMLSHIDFDSQVLQDNDDEELEKEDAKQDIEIKEFLANELGDEDLLDDTYESNVTQHEVKSSLYNPQEQPNSYLNNYGLSQFSVEDQHGANNSYIDTNPNFQDTHLVGNYTTQNYTPYPYYEGAQQQSSQIEILYQARGKKIEELQLQLEESTEEFAKEKRIMQHKFNMISAEKNGMHASNEQLRNLLEQYKLDIKNFEDQNNETVEENEKLKREIFELEEKLSISDSTIDALQLQITELSKSDSLSRARAQHESLLASVREKHKNEVLSLNEKLDDMKQALAWKTEDVNRYKEMLDSSSSSSEIGILRSRLAAEERKCSEMFKKLENLNRDNKDLEDQLATYQNLLSDKSGYLSSTPLNAANAMLNQRKKLDFQSPIATNLANNVKTPTATDTNLRKELLKTLSSNHEKRKEIMLLREEVQVLQNKKESPKKQPDAVNTNQKSTECEKCKELQKDLERLKYEANELRTQNEVLAGEKADLENEMAQVKSNMSDMLRNFDDEKTRFNQSQNVAIMKLIDDAKLRLTSELTEIHENEKNSLLQQIEVLAVENMTAKQEYIRLCDELKSIEKRLKDELESSKKIELEELKLELQSKFLEERKNLENELALKHFNEIESERLKTRDSVTIELENHYKEKINTMQDELQMDFDERKKVDIKEAVLKAKNQWECNCKKHELELMQSETISLKKQIGVLEKKLLSCETVIEDFKTKDEWLQNNIEAIKKPTDSSATSLIFNEILNSSEKNLLKNENCSKCQYFINQFQQMEKDCKIRESELASLITKTTDQLNKSFDKSQLELSCDESNSLQSSIDEQFSMDSPKLDVLLKSRIRSWTIKEKSFKVELNKLNESTEKWKERCNESENHLINLREENLNLKNENEQIKKDVDKLETKLKNGQQQYELQKKELEKHYENLMKDKFLEAKEKQHVETSKLKEEVIKAENELIKTHLLTDLQATANVSHEVNLIQQKYESRIQELKQGFREKLTQIHEMKKKWLQEEEEKRENLKQRLHSEHTENVLQLQSDHKAYVDKVTNNLQNKLIKLENENETKCKVLQEEIKVLQEEIQKKDHFIIELEEKANEAKVHLEKEHSKEIELLNAEFVVKIQTAEQRMRDDVTSQMNEELSKAKKQYEIDLKEAYQKGYSNAKESSHSAEKIRQIYLQTLQEINNDVMKHVQVTKQQAVQQLKNLLTNQANPVRSFKSKEKRESLKDQPQNESKGPLNNMSHQRNRNQGASDSFAELGTQLKPEKNVSPENGSNRKPEKIASPYFKNVSHRTNRSSSSNKTNTPTRHELRNADNMDGFLDDENTTFESSLFTSLRELPNTPKTPRRHEFGGIT